MVVILLKGSYKTSKESRRGYIAFLLLLPAITNSLSTCIGATKFPHVNPVKSYSAFWDLPGARIFLRPYIYKQPLSVKE